MTTVSRIYVASSWRNTLQPTVVFHLRRAGHEVYDFRNPPNGDPGFSWSEIDENWQFWRAHEYRTALSHPAALRGFHNDYWGMNWADTCLLLLPCGRSAHLEAGFMAGQGKRVIVLTRDGEEPELMAKLCTHICVSLDEVLTVLSAEPTPQQWAQLHMATA